MPLLSLPSPPTLFPTYLVPSFFPRRKSSTDSNASTSTTTSERSTNTPTPPSNYLTTTPTSLLHCARCHAHLAHSTQIISKGFTGRHGRAYLVSPACTTASATNALPNVYTHKAVPRQLVTGMHTVGDISCSHCGSVLGWKYVAAEMEEQKYKVGKYILEAKRVCRDVEWEGGDEVERVEGGREVGSADGEVEFDSQDEDECDALFSGQWTREFAVETRRMKKGRLRGAR